LTLEPGNALEVGAALPVTRNVSWIGSYLDKSVLDSDNEHNFDRSREFNPAIEKEMAHPPFSE
jgi:hypothetical protein